MDLISEYFGTVLSAFIAAGICSVLVPDKSGIGKCVRYLISLCVIISIASPLRPAMSYLMDIFDGGAEIENMIDSELDKYVENTNKLIIEQNTKTICEALKNELREKMSIPSHECDITLDTEIDNGEIRITRVNVILSGYSMWKDAKEIKALVYSLVGAECEVIAG